MAEFSYKPENFNIVYKLFFDLSQIMCYNNTVFDFVLFVWHFLLIYIC